MEDNIRIDLKEIGINTRGLAGKIIFLWVAQNVKNSFHLTTLKAGKIIY